MTNTTEMPEKIWAEPVESGKVRGQWTKSLWTDRDVPYTRTDTIPKITVIRWNPKGYWEALSDGSKAFEGYNERIEEEFMEANPEHDSEVPEAWQIVPAGKWQAQIDFSLEEIVSDYEQQEYQVFVIPKPISKAEVAREFFNMVLRHEQVWLNLMSRSKPPLTRNEFMQVVHDVLKEWEDAESKTNSI